MIFIIQGIVIITAAAIVVMTLGRRTTHSGRAWKKIVLVMLALCMVVAVMYPDVTNLLARLVGVGRGADLLLYITVVTFIGYVLNEYIHRQDERDAVYRLARKIAIIEANETYEIMSKK